MFKRFRSKRSIKRFIRLMLGLPNSEFVFHQTLTFTKEVSPDEAKKALKDYFDLVTKWYSRKQKWFAIYCEEQRPRIHYHVIFAVFPEKGVSAEVIRQELQRCSRPAWANQHSDPSKPKANLLNASKSTEKALEY